MVGGRDKAGEGREREETCFGSIGASESVAYYEAAALNFTQQWFSWPGYDQAGPSEHTELLLLHHTC